MPYGHPVILSFGHEMNGDWYLWGYRHTSPASVRSCLAAHCQHLSRLLGAWNVTWMWTINVVHTWSQDSQSPAPWWPGSSYVTWVGIDGYYYQFF